MKHFILSITALLLLTLYLPAQSAASERPNVILVICDDLAHRAIGAYGGTMLETPRLDRMAKEGARFDSAYVTNSLCSPSRAAILTGKYSHLNGVRDNAEPFDGSQVTLPKLLQEAGYQTAMVGKWHLHSDPTGFDYWSVLPGQGVYVDPTFVGPEGETQKEGYVTEIVTQEAIQWLSNRREKSKPFYLQIGHKAPHSWWQPEKKYASLFEEDTLPEPPSLHEDISHRSAPVQHVEATLDPKGIFEHEKAFYRRHRADFENLPQGMPDKEVRSWIYQKYIKDYLRTSASIDEQMGRLLDFLDENGLADNTLIIFTSDQGYFLGEHGFYGKQLMYEEAFSTPLLVRYPKEIAEETVVNQLAVNIDLAPTVLDYAGVSIPEEMQGRSLRSLINAKQEVGKWRDAVYYRFYHPGWGHTPHEGVRTSRYKLIRFYANPKAPREDYWELYDLKNDPKEMNNIYEDAPAELVGELRDKLIALRRELRVPEDNSDLLFEMGSRVPPLEN